VILKGSPNIDNAYKLINFLGQAKNQAKLPEAIAYGVTAKGANALIPKARLADLPTADENFAHAVQIDTAFWMENIDRLTEQFNKWAATK